MYTTDRVISPSTFRGGCVPSIYSLHFIALSGAQLSSTSFHSSIYETPQHSKFGKNRANEMRAYKSTNIDRQTQELSTAIHIRKTLHGGCTHAEQNELAYGNTTAKFEILFH